MNVPLHALFLRMACGSAYSLLLALGYMVPLHLHLRTVKTWLSDTFFETSNTASYEETYAQPAIVIIILVLPSTYKWSKRHQNQPTRYGGGS